ncbi:MAG: cytochrome c biogenesis protein CcsA [Gallionellaceae bacterium]
MSNLVLTLITFIAYSALAFFFWRAQVAGNAEKLNRGNLGHAVGIPLAFHAWLLYENLFVGGSLNLSLVYTLSLILWLTLLVYWIGRFFYPLSCLLTLVLPLAAFGVALPSLFPAVHKLAEPTSWMFDAHVLVAMLAYSLFTIAALHAGLMSLVERRLHRATMPKILISLPPLLTMETLLFRIIAIGMALLTLTLASGILFSEQIFGKPWQFNHKVLFGFISWGIFGVLLLGHSLQGWRGRTAVRWTLSGFGFLILAYLGTKFVLEVILHR